MTNRNVITYILRMSSREHEIDPQVLLDRCADTSLAFRLSASTRRQPNTDELPIERHVQVFANILYQRRVGEKVHPEKYRGHNQNTDWLRAQLSLVGAPRELRFVIEQLAAGKSMQEIKNLMRTVNFLRKAPVDLPDWDEM